MMGKNNILGFLEELSENNHKEWFDANKSKYLEAKEEMEILVDKVIQALSEFDPSIADQLAKKCVFRIYRDVRFSKNKAPYKNNMGAFIVPGGKKSAKAGYYFHIQPGECFVGGGIYMPESKILKSLREEVMFNIKEFNEIIGKPEFKSNFKEIYGEKLKRPPKGFPADFEEIELLKLKSYALSRSVDDDFVNQDDFVEQVVDIFRTMIPYNQFLNRAFDV